MRFSIVLYTINEEKLNEIVFLGFVNTQKTLYARTNQNINQF